MFLLWCTKCELAATVKLTEAFHHETYALEGDGVLVFTTYDIVCRVRDDITSKHTTMDYPSTRRIIRDALVHAIPGDNTEQFWRTHTRMITLPGDNTPNLLCTEKQKFTADSNTFIYCKCMITPGWDGV